jgi:hypothetical protein
MADISIQFHALPEELREFVKQIVPEFGLHVIAIRFPPYRAVELDSEQVDEAFTDSSPYDELAFTLRQPILPAKGNMEFCDKNPDALWLAIGKRTKTDLRESWLSARTENAAVLAVWKKIAKRLRGMTERGALAVQPKTGATGPARDHRYTAGAKALEASGVPMLTITGIILKLGQTEDADPRGSRKPKSR